MWSYSISTSHCPIANYLHIVLVPDILKLAELLSPEGGVRNSVGREPYVRCYRDYPRPAGARVFFSVRVVGLTPYAIADAAFGAEEFCKLGQCEVEIL